MLYLIRLFHKKTAGFQLSIGHLCYLKNLVNGKGKQCIKVESLEISEMLIANHNNNFYINLAIKLNGWDWRLTLFVIQVSR